MRHNRARSVASNPVLVGAVTTLLVIIAVFLAYNANRGLPFVPTYQVKTELPSAANLVKGNEVRMGGARVGVIDDLKPIQRRDGSVAALLTLTLEKSVKPLPVDSTVLVRARSALGLKYVAITRGHARKGYIDGDTIPLRNATPRPVEIDQVFNTFDTPTREAGRTNLRGFGNALAGRGNDVNDAIRALRPLLRDLVPVMGNLADPRTRLGRLFVEIGRVARIVAPAGETQAALFVNLDRTFAALASVARPYIQQAIERGPRTLDTVTPGLAAQRPFLRNAQGLFAELRPGVRALRGAAPALADALTVGTPTLRRVPVLSGRLKPVFSALERFSTDPLVPLGVRELAGAARALDPTLAFLTPAQVVCNYVTLFFRNISSLLSEGDRNGTWQRFIIVATPLGPNSEGGPSSGPANGPTIENHLHANPYPNTASPGQPHECEAGNETYLAGKTVTGNVPGNQGTTTSGQVRK